MDSAKSAAIRTRGSRPTGAGNGGRGGGAMTAGECMTREFEAIHPEAPVEEVVRRLKTPDADPIPVCDGNRLIGMVSYRDVTAGAATGVRRGGQVRGPDLAAQAIIY